LLQSFQSFFVCLLILMFQVLVLYWLYSLQIFSPSSYFCLFILLTQGSFAELKLHFGGATNFTFFETGSHYVVQAVLSLLRAGIAGMHITVFLLLLLLASLVS
jgi:hypothetical protein